jgi:amino acid adenylation domain-containing protein
MLIQDFLRENVQRRPEQIGLVCAGRRFSFRELDHLSNQLAHFLVAQGLQRGERVALFLPNCLEAVVGILGVLKAGGAFVMVNPTTKHDKLEFILRDCAASALLADGALLSRFEPASFPSLKALIVRERVRGADAGAVETGPEIRPGSGSTNPPAAQTGTVSFASLFQHSPGEALPARNVDLDLACLIYTSGSTGEAKGVMCDHSNVVFVTRSIVQYLGNTETDVVLSVLPLSFSYGLYQLMAALCSGARLVLEESFAFPAAILKKMAAERVTGFAGVPTIYAILLGLDLSVFDLTSLRYLTNAAAALPVEHVRRLRERLPRVDLFLMHGLTEVARTVYLPPEQVDRRPGSVGHAIPGTEIWLEDESGRRVGPGEVGEMVVRGRHVMRGYWNNPEATHARFRPGPLPGERVCHSGDLFRADEEGFLYFVSRQDDIIKCRGEKVSPREVENVLYAMEGVLEAAVVGVADPVFGQAIKAFVVAPGQALTAPQVLAHCKKHLEDLMVPKYVEFREELPKTASGKIRKVDLR